LGVVFKLRLFLSYGYAWKTITVGLPSFFKRKVKQEVILCHSPRRFLGGEKEGIFKW